MCWADRPIRRPCKYGGNTCLCETHLQKVSVVKHHESFQQSLSSEILPLHSERSNGTRLASMTAASRELDHLGSGTLFEKGALA